MLKKLFAVLAMLLAIVSTAAAQTIAVGQTVQLSSSLSNPKWSSANPAIASVTQTGLVTGNSAGQTSIKAQKRGSKQFFTITVTGGTQSEICGDGIDNDGDGQIDENPPCELPPPPPPTGDCKSNPGLCRPQAALTCPAGSVDIFPGVNIQSIINANSAGTIYCLRAGLHLRTTSVIPKTGDTIHGEFGATLDGSGLAMFDGNNVIGGWNCSNCANVTVRNLTIIGNQLINCIGAYGPNSGNWTLDHNDISGCRWGVNFGRAWEGTHLNKPYVAGPRIEYNYIHHNKWSGATGSNGSGAYGFQNTDGQVFRFNELAFNGGQPKWTGAKNSIVTDNYIHDNVVGIWHDGDNLNALNERNILEDNCAEGIFFEISAGAIIRNNTIKRNGFGCPENPFGSGMYISTSRDVEVSFNVFEDNFRDMNTLVQCPAVKPAGFFYPTQIEYDLRNLNIHDNVVRVANQESNVMAAALGSVNCTTEEYARYVDPNIKNIRFTGNTYEVFNLNGFWFFSDGWRNWSGWQTLGHDITGTIIQR